MRIEHTLEVAAICPVDGKPDVYACTVRTRRVIPVERILEAAKAIADSRVFQEDLTLTLHRALAAEVETIGWHSGVMTRVVVGGAE